MLPLYDKSWLAIHFVHSEFWYSSCPQVWSWSKALKEQLCLGGSCSHSATGWVSVLLRCSFHLLWVYCKSRFYQSLQCGLLTLIEICSKAILGWCICVCRLKVPQHACVTIEDEKVTGSAWCGVGVAQGWASVFIISYGVEGSINVFIFDVVGCCWRGESNKAEIVIRHNT